MKKIVIASSNQGKIDEFKKIFEAFDCQVLSKAQVGLEDLEVVEDAPTLEGNSEKKARAIWERVKAPVLADDTGLFVEALGGRPGLYTARYAGEGCSPKDNRVKLLGELEGLALEERKADFITSLVIIDQEGQSHLAQGICPGYISLEERGQGGFGYDSVFIPEGYKETFAELDPEIKNTISHRALALKKLSTMIEEIL